MSYEARLKQGGAWLVRDGVSSYLFDEFNEFVVRFNEV